MRLRRDAATWRLARLVVPVAGWWLAAAAAPAQPHPSAAPAPAPGIAFMQGMITHHAQALEMTALIEGRTSSGSMRRLGERITVSQRDEIALMSNWLRDRKADLPGSGTGHAHHDHATMPGMATPEQMADLATRRGRAFDRRFLELMIRHHEGALVMVREVMPFVGGADEGELFRFATDVDADQRAEIRRMQALLASLSPAPARAMRRRT